MSSINKAVIVGRLGKVPTVRMAGQNEVANLSVATSESWKDKQSGEWKEKTEWHRVTVWGGAVQVVRDLDVGDLVWIEGPIQTRKYEKDGQDVYTTEIVVQGFGSTVKVLGRKNPRQSEHNQQKQDGYQPQPELDDDIPF